MSGDYVSVIEQYETQKSKSNTSTPGINTKLSSIINLENPVDIKFNNLITRTKVSKELTGNFKSERKQNVDFHKNVNSNSSVNNITKHEYNLLSNTHNLKLKD